MKEVADVHGEVTFTEEGRVVHPHRDAPEGATIPDGALERMPDYPSVPAAFTNALAEEGTKAEVVEFLRKQWNETCYLRSAIKDIEIALACDDIDGAMKIITGLEQ